MKTIFQFRDSLIDEYARFSRSFTKIDAADIQSEIDAEYDKGRYWPEPLVQINPNYRRENTVADLVAEGILHRGCEVLFKAGKTGVAPASVRLFTHQLQSVNQVQQNRSFVVTTGTGSGKSLSFFLPIIDRILKAKEKDPTPKTRAIIIYPMNALANSQAEEIAKFMANPGAKDLGLRVEPYTGQEKEAARRSLAENPPDILLTNFMMLELILTRFDQEVDLRVVNNCQGLEFLVLDELHTYRGRQGADVAMLVRRLRQRLNAPEMICIGTSATMSSTGTPEDQKRTVATVASKIFGAPIEETDVIDETLIRATDEAQGLESVKPLLKSRLSQPSGQWANLGEFRKDPLAIWAELTLGLEMRDLSTPRRARPRRFSEAADKLAADAEVPFELASEALQSFLTYAQDLKSEDGRHLFAFKLHQFISGPGKVHCTLEDDGHRVISLEAQRFAPGRRDDDVLLFSTHFCRECGQEYHPVWESGNQVPHFNPREIDDVGEDDENRHFGFLAPIRPGQLFQGNFEELPESWQDSTGSDVKVKPTYKNAVPCYEKIDSRGHRGSGRAFWFIPGKFRFCLKCGFEHQAHGRDINRLSSLSGEGRSSATTVLTLGILRQHFEDDDSKSMDPDPRKLLGFSDNRQDAALQAGHFNDFLYLLIIRSGLLGALRSSSTELTVETLADEVFKALGFDSTDEGILSEYLNEPDIFGPQKNNAERAIRFVLGYRLLRDLRKGWRFNNPNLLQLDLLQIDYLGLDEMADRDALFSREKQSKIPPAHTDRAPLVEVAWDRLRALSPKSRANLGRIVFDSMLRDLCVASNYFDTSAQERIAPLVSDYLTERWSFGADERLVTTKFLILDKRPDAQGKKRDDLIGGGARSRLIREIRFSKTWGDEEEQSLIHKAKGDELVELVRAFLHAASNFVESRPVAKPGKGTATLGWVLKDTAIVWKLNPNPVQDGSRANEFFRQLYDSVSRVIADRDHHLYDYEAHEHTAQVEPEKRKVLEARFRMSDRDKEWWSESGQKGPLVRLPVLYCSPTMELGVDISALNTVYMRNVPPTPANYAQRSGRAGRSGQAALVVTYCAAMSPHDQWFFAHANDMVHGVVKAPTLDLKNRDLIESHLHAVWLASAQTPISTSIAEMLDLEEPVKPLIQDLQDRLTRPEVRERAVAAASKVIKQVSGELQGCDWFHDQYVEQVIDRSASAFDHAFDRWRELYDATQRQLDRAFRIHKSPSTPKRESDSARTRYLDALNQINLLKKTGGGQNNDFYTFRYLASQGFLPGYNFPRLPLMAWIPAAGRSRSGEKEAGAMVSRPRFLALSEFGPRSLIYHEGRMFRVTRAKLNVTNADHISSEAKLGTINALICTYCGYGHLGRPEDPEPKDHVCEYCGKTFVPESRVNQLYRIDTVETHPVDRISVNEEDRQRQGFDIVTTYRFLPGPGGVLEKRSSDVVSNEEKAATLTYSPAAALWRINRGWRRRKNKNQLGFYINPLTGQWSKGEDPSESGDDEKDEEENSKVSPQQIVPFVEDHRNVLILTPSDMLEEGSMATIQAALARGIEQTFQIESSELAVEPLPSRIDRRSFLLYESAEGGAGVLNQLATDSVYLALAARKALTLMHFTVPDGPFEIDQLTEQEAGDDSKIFTCEAGCYHCLLSYFNQPDHEIIDRRDREALRFLVSLANGQIVPSSPLIVQGKESDASDQTLLDQWLQLVARLSLRQPDQTLVPLNGTDAVADAIYRGSRSVIFLTPPPPEIEAYAADRGYHLVTFGESQDRWEKVFRDFPDIFGSPPPTS